MILRVLLGFCLIVISTSCVQENLEEDFGECETDNVRYSVDIVDMMNANCHACHGAANYQNFGAGINLSTYSSLKVYVDNGRFLGAVDHQDGFSAMPQGRSKMDDCTIDKIKSWINEGAQNN